MALRGKWSGSSADEALEVRVPAQGVALVIIPKAASGATSRIYVVQSAADGLATALQALAAPAAFIDSSGISISNIEHVRCIGSQAATNEATAWLSKVGVRMGRAVVVPDPGVPLYFHPVGGRLRMRTGAADPVAARALPGTASPPQLAGSPAGQKFRVLIVDDSKTMRDLLSRVIGADPQLEVVGTVAEPERVEAAVAELKPHVVTLDIHMGAMNGVEVVRRIFPLFRIPIVMISSLSASDGSFVFDALLAGAVDYIQKPSMKELGVVAPVICDKVRAAAMSRASAHGNSTPGRKTPVAVSGSLDKDFLIAIGSSTGGVEALREVLTALPAQIPGIVIVQHIPPVFSKAFADRMGSLCPFTVKEAEDGELVQANKVLIAPGGLQMHIKQTPQGLAVGIVDSEPVNRHKPSVDYLFDSVVALKRPKVAAAILTGMGADGARGLLKLRQAGARTLAQDEATCVVYGMPREAAKLGGAEEVVPLPKIAEALLKFCSSGSRRSAP